MRRAGRCCTAVSRYGAVGVEVAVSSVNLCPATSCRQLLDAVDDEAGAPPPAACGCRRSAGCPRRSSASRPAARRRPGRRRRTAGRTRRGSRRSPASRCRRPSSLWLTLPAWTLVLDGLVGLQVLVGQLEAVVPQRDLAGAQLLAPSPSRRCGPRRGCRRRRPRRRSSCLLGQVGVALRRVGHDHRVAAGGVLEEVEDALFFHEPAGEVEVGLAVLHAVVARVERAPGSGSRRRGPSSTFLRMSGTVRCWKMRLWARLGQQPELRHDLQAVGGEGRCRGAPWLTRLQMPLK